jgi:hypothetical protein
MLVCRLCQNEKPIEAFTRRGNQITTRCKECHAYEQRVSRHRRDADRREPQSELIEHNEMHFAAGLQGKTARDLRAGLSFPLTHVRTGALGTLYVKRWEYRARPLTEIVLEFGDERIGFDLSMPNAFARIPRALWQSSLRIEGMPAAYDGVIPVPTEIERAQIPTRASLSVVKGAWECTTQPTEAVARLYRLDVRYLELLIHRAGWKRVEIKAGDVEAFRRTFGLG